MIYNLIFFEMYAKNIDWGPVGWETTGACTARPMASQKAAFAASQNPSSFYIKHTF